MKSTRLLIPGSVLAIVVAAIALTAGGGRLASPTPAQTRPAAVTAEAGQSLVDAGLASSSSSGELAVDVPAATALLESLPVSDAGSPTPYDRDAYGQAWADTNHNGCDTRNDVLARDLTAETFKPGTHDCVVLTGTLADPYTGSTIAFVRGQGTSEKVQIDHLIPLGLAWQHGASGWSAEQRESFANDFDNLTAVDGSSNSSKSDKGPDEWLPTLAYQCEYVTRFTYVASKYSLSLATTDEAAIAKILPTCK